MKLGFSAGKRWNMLAVLVLLVMSSVLSTVNGFATACQRRCRWAMNECTDAQTHICMTNTYNDEDGTVGDGDMDSGGKVLHDLSWRVAKLKLEEANTRRFLKARPRYLPYDECRKWVQAWNRWENEQDWIDWIDQGEKRNAYIPARPDEYYGRLGQWKGWDHFLSKVDSNDKNGREDSSTFD